MAPSFPVALVTSLDGPMWYTYKCNCYDLRTMIKRLIKFFVFGLVLALLSIGYKFFAGNDSKYPTLGGSNKASADVPGCAGSGGSAEGSAEGGGGSAGGSAEGGGGSAGGSGGSGTA